MDHAKIFGEDYIVNVRESDDDSVKIQGNTILITTHEKPAHLLFKQFASNLLRLRLLDLWGKMKGMGNIEVFGDLDLEVVDLINGKKGGLVSYRETSFK